MDHTANDLRRLRDIFAPMVVAVPPGNPHRSLCRMPGGEIRFYGSYPLEGGKVRSYISSVNHGLDWRTVLVDGPQVLGPMIQSPYSGRWVSILRSQNYNVQSLPVINDQPKGVYVILSEQGPGHSDYELIRICDLPLLDIRQPIPMRSRNRWLCTSQIWHEGALCPVVLRSDDDGVAWQWTILETVPAYVAGYPHKGARWQQYSCEPTIIERSDGSLMLISRTSQDFHYVYYCQDGGESWTSPVASEYFHATTTMPTLMRLQDGRLLFFWCNTQPLPEVDHTNQIGADDDIRNGVWEDVFTNRDACHAAISEDDGRTWIGFREIGLNEIRDHADYRNYLSSSANDKSMHQFESLELSEGKVLVVYGQAPSSRRIIILDPAWLYEKSNSENFSKGFAHLSTHMYVNSISGGAAGPEKLGHCAWNRTYGPLLVPDPAGTFKEVLHLTMVDDPRLFNNRQGVTWNFPACCRGNVQVKMHIADDSLRLSLTDRWFNPCDEYVGELTQFSTVITRDMLPEGSFWTDVTVSWDTDTKQAELSIADNKQASFTIDNISPAGLSYLHLQAVSSSPKHKGSYIMSMQQSAE